MAKAVYEQRTFTSGKGEIIKYDWFGVQAEVNGEYMELKLENLNSAEKTAFKMISTGIEPKNYSVAVGGKPDGEPKVTRTSVDDFFKENDTDDNKINLDDED